MDEHSEGSDVLTIMLTLFLVMVALVLGWIEEKNQTI